jgi:hypothetical protein
VPTIGPPDTCDMGMTMDHTFFLIMIGLTSIGAYSLGVKRLRLSRYGLWLALGKTCETIGLALIFFLLNLIVGISVVFAGRFFMGTFVSLYYMSDVTLLVLSLFQAFTFQAWRADSRPSYSPDVCRGDLFHREQ